MRRRLLRERDLERSLLLTVGDEHRIGARLDHDADVLVSGGASIEDQVVRLEGALRDGLAVVDHVSGPAGSAESATVRIRTAGPLVAVGGEARAIRVERQ